MKPQPQLQCEMYPQVTSIVTATHQLESACTHETRSTSSTRCKSSDFFFSAKQFLLAKRLLVVWVIGNSIVFLNSYSEYKNNSKYYYVYSMLGSGLCISRGTANILNFQLCIIFLSVCRTLRFLLVRGLRKLRHAVTHDTKLNNVQQVGPTRGPDDHDINDSNNNNNSNSDNNEQESVRDNNTQQTDVDASTSRGSKFCQSVKLIVFFCISWCLDHLFIPAIDQIPKLHAYSGFTIAVASACHTIAHVFNAINFSYHYNTEYPDVNAASFRGQEPIELILYTMPGITGLLMVAVLLIIIALACQWVRCRFYDAFSLSHRLFIVFVVLLYIHPLSGLLKEQINVHYHSPPCDFKSPSVSSVTSNITRVTDQSITPGHLIRNHSSHVLSPSTSSSESNSTALLLDLTVKVKNTTEPITRTKRHNQRSILNAIDENGKNSSAHSDSRVNSTSGKPTLELVHSANSVDLKCSQEPRFASLKPKTWRWLTFALIVYLLDVLLCLYYSRTSECNINERDEKKDDQSNVSNEDGKKKIMQATATLYEECNVIELAICDAKKRSACKMVTPGSYVYIKCPAISSWQWHPFSVTPASDATCDFAVWISVVGDWSGKLKECIRQRHMKHVQYNQLQVHQLSLSSQDETQKCASTLTTGSSSYPAISLIQTTLEIQLTGPFSSPYERIVSYKTSLFICTGIGITPVLSFLEWMVKETKNNSCSCNDVAGTKMTGHTKSGMIRKRERFKLRQLHLIWIAKNTHSFQYMISFLSSVAKQLQENTACTRSLYTVPGESDFVKCNNNKFQLQIHLYATRQEVHKATHSMPQSPPPPSSSYSFASPETANDHCSGEQDDTEDKLNATQQQEANRKKNNYNINCDEQISREEQVNHSRDTCHCQTCTCCVQQHESKLEEQIDHSSSSVSSWPSSSSLKYLHHGRPDLYKILSSFNSSSSPSSSSANNHPSSQSLHTIGVFVCGQASVRKSVKKTIKRVNLEQRAKRFVYHSESFC